MFLGRFLGFVRHWIARVLLMIDRRNRGKLFVNRDGTRQIVVVVFKCFYSIGFCLLCIGGIRENMCEL